MKMKKTIPALPVQNIKISMDFYTTKLGFAVRHHDGGFAIVVRDEVEIHLWRSGDESWKTKGAFIISTIVAATRHLFPTNLLAAFKFADLLAALSFLSSNITYAPVCPSPIITFILISLVLSVFMKYRSWIST